MLLRFRWLTFGMLLALSGGAVVVSRMVRLRRSFNAANLRTTAAATGADALDWLAVRLRGSTTPQG